MKRLLALILVFALALTSCSQSKVPESPSQPSIAESSSAESGSSDGSTNDSHPEAADTTNDSIPEAADTTETPEADTAVQLEFNDVVPEFSRLDNTGLLRYVEDNVYAELVAQLNSDDYFVENISAVYVSKEYLEEMAFNSQSNVFFGYTLAELDAEFEGTRYVFTLGDDGSTIVQAFETYDDTYEQVIKNVAIGTGVILVCVTVSTATAGAGAPAVSMIFAASAKTGTAFALSSGTLAFAASAITTGMQTKDPKAALNAGVLSGSESFKWGAIIGCITGGVKQSLTLHNTALSPNNDIPSPHESEALTPHNTDPSPSSGIPSPRESELRAAQKYGGEEQVSFLNGQKVPYGTPGSTKPDLVITSSSGEYLEAIEVKNYNLETNLPQLCRELKRQVSQRVTDLPSGSTQRIVLDVQGRGYAEEILTSASTTIETALAEIYPNIPIDFLY